LFKEAIEAAEVGPY
jgi:hypothetical protein